MLEVKNIEVAFLHRAFKASANPMKREQLMEMTVAEAEEEV
jgi:hypothetical protein